MDERTSIPVRNPVSRSITEFRLSSQTLSKANGSIARPQRCQAEVKNVLRQLGFTVTDISALTGVRYGKKSPYFIPISALYKLKKGITPRLCQIVALSQITGYCFADWMRICGFDPQLILHLQLQLDNKRTTIINPQPLERARDNRVSFSNGLANGDPPYFFAKVGTDDAVVYPRLVPGTVVRANPNYEPSLAATKLIEKRLWLVQHPAGVSCCYLRRIDAQHVVLLPSRPPLTPWPLHVSREIRLLGLIDWEWQPRFPAPFRPMPYHRFPEALPSPAWHDTTSVSFSRFLRSARFRAGLTLRSAHEMTTRIASFLGNREYSIALGLLSDYEAIDRLPRHVAKIISLCVVYGIDLFELLKAAGIQVEDCGKASLSFEDQIESEENKYNFRLATAEMFYSVA